jgi:bifunctional oligoribonuclease and PAP phosphatase NrnA
MALATNSPLPEIAERLIAAQRILVLCHVDPDGDAIGSLLGLGWLLRGVQGERTVILTCQDPVPPNLRFLPGADDIVAEPPDLAWNVIVALDASDPRRLGTPLPRCPGGCLPTHRSIVIDHHITNTFFGDVHLRQSRALRLLRRSSPTWQSPSASRLPARQPPACLTGLLTDTLGFRTANTTAAALATGMRLVEAGGNLAELSQRTLSDRPLAVLRLWGAALNRLHIKDGVISVAVSREMRREAGISDEETGELVSQLITANEARVAAVFTEIEDGKVKVSLRARRGYNVADTALSLGGGGHPQAAGCMLSGTLEEVQDRLLPLLAAIAEQGEDL